MYESSISSAMHDNLDFRGLVCDVVIPNFEVLCHSLHGHFANEEFNL